MAVGVTLVVVVVVRTRHCLLVVVLEPGLFDLVELEFINEAQYQWLQRTYPLPPVPRKM